MCTNVNIETLYEYLERCVRKFIMNRISLVKYNLATNARDVGKFIMDKIFKLGQLFFFEEEKSTDQKL
jgi:hypothetical protein